jgi:hypothetical protein
VVIDTAGRNVDESVRLLREILYKQ